MQTRPPIQPAEERPHRSAEDGPETERWRDRGRSAPAEGPTARAVDECVALLRQSLVLFEALPHDDYVAPQPSPHSVWSSPGAHARHLLDFVDCLLDGLEARRIDYTARKRSPEVEASRGAGRRAIEGAIEGLDRLRGLDGHLPLEVRPELDQDWTPSSLAREIQSVSGHVVHHHALIHMVLAHRGIEAPSDYGVAPSTLAHRAAIADDAGGDD